MQKIDIADNLSTYPAYKPSGVNWLGDVPAHWEARRLRRFVHPDSVKAGYEISFPRCVCSRSTRRRISGLIFGRWSGSRRGCWGRFWVGCEVHTMFEM